MPSPARPAYLDRTARIVPVFVLSMLAAAPAVTAQESGFPYDRELLLDAAPMTGSKRVPSLEVGGSGAAVIDLWCASARGQFVFAGETLTVIIGPLNSQSCPPDREKADAGLVAALTEVTNWRRQGSEVVLLGPKNLRYRSQAN
jgi:hypothetical protein